MESFRGFHYSFNSFDWIGASKKSDPKGIVL